MVKENILIKLDTDIMFASIKHQTNTLLKLVGHRWCKFEKKVYIICLG